jgi:hypothetical protein
MSHDITRLRPPTIDSLDRVTSALAAHGCELRGGKAKCPAHEDRNPSLSVSHRDGQVLLYCHAGCSIADVVAALGLAMADLFDERRERRPLEVARPVYHVYHDEDGAPVARKVRRGRGDSKVMTWQRPEGDRWVSGLNGFKPPLYRLPELIAAPERFARPGEIGVVWLVEGELDADRLASMGEVATSPPDGASKDAAKPKWSAAYNRFFAGLDVIIVADNDPCGYAHARAARAGIEPFARSVVIWKSPLPREKADVSDHLDAGLTLDDLIDLPDDPPDRPPDFAEVIDLPRPAPTYTPVDWADLLSGEEPETDWLIEPVIERGTLNSMWGKPGSNKSLVALLDFAVKVADSGLHVAYFDDENRKHGDIDVRVRSAGLTAERLANVHLFSYAGLPPLDTEPGGRELLSLARDWSASLVILDTTARYVSGEEDAADTWHRLYRFTLAPLKAAGVTVLRLDHPGKDPSKGQRGSSAKTGDVDTIWHLTADPAGLELTLTNDKCRSGAVQQGHVIKIRKHLDPTRFEWDDWQAAKDAEILAAHRISADASKRAVREALPAGVLMGDRRILAAQRYRKEHGGEPEGA